MSNHNPFRINCNSIRYGSKISKAQVRCSSKITGRRWSYLFVSFSYNASLYRMFSVIPFLDLLLWLCITLPIFFSLFPSISKLLNPFLIFSLLPSISKPDKRARDGALLRMILPLYSLSSLNRISQRPTFEIYNTKDQTLGRVLLTVRLIVAKICDLTFLIIYF